MDAVAKSALAKTVRSLRARLIEDFHNALEARYRLSRRVHDAGLDDGRRAERERIDEWLDEQLRGEESKKKKQRRSREDFVGEVVREAAYTLINRLVLLRLMEEAELVGPPVVKGGWQSKGYREWCDWAPALLDDETDGYAVLLNLVFDELAHDLPGLYGDVGLTELVPLPPQTLRAAVEALNDEALDPCWSDDTTLGWVYQYFNDPDREALDAKINSRGKIEPHEVASKTQLFTERYMVEWLLQNSLGPLWFEICDRNGWTPEVVEHGVLAELDRRRAHWREKREAGEVELDELMPIHSDVEDRWKYYVPPAKADEADNGSAGSLPASGADAGAEEAPRRSPKSLRTLKILDPACGSGHFLVIAFDLLFALYEEEARHRGESWSDEEVTRWIIEDNLHGIDIDRRAAQIAAAALYLKGRTAAPDFHPRKLNLVAPDLTIGNLPDDDPALVELRRAVEEETGIPAELIDKIVHSLKEAHHLGSLLKIDDEIDQALRDLEAKTQTDMWASNPLSLEETSDARQALIELLEEFLASHSSSEDLGLRLRGEQLANGIRFVRMNREGRYDLVVANPPYLGSSNMRSKKYIKKHYPRGKADLYACFLERGLQFVRRGGRSAMVSMRGWMFIKTYEDLRAYLIGKHNLYALGDMGAGAFAEIGGHVVQASMSVLRDTAPDDEKSVAVNLTDEDASSSNRSAIKQAALLVQIRRHEFSSKVLEGIGGQPLVYWWNESFVRKYVEAPKLVDLAPTNAGLQTSNNSRYVRNIWEIGPESWGCEFSRAIEHGWASFIKGGKQREWIEPLLQVVNWSRAGLEVKVASSFLHGSVGKRVANEHVYFIKGVAVSLIGSEFRARAHRYSSIIDVMGTSVFPDDISGTLCLLNSNLSRRILGSLNPTVHFQVGDVERLAVFPIESADEIFAKLDEAFTEHEAARETSVEFKEPGRSCWEYAQDWAQRAVDRPEGNPLPDWDPTYDEVPPENWLSWAVGVALGRFDREGREGWLDEAPEDALEAGILYISATDFDDSLADPACRLLHDMWEEHGDEVGRKKDDINSWLREKFFKDVHRQMYDNAPIYFPVSSKNKNFVAHINIHRWTAHTLRTLRATWLNPERRNLEELRDNLRTTVETAEGSDRTRADRRLDDTNDLLTELEEFIADVRQCAEFGPPPTDSKCPEREVDAPYDPVLDDGTMINAAALWPILDPLWKKYPKKWWKRLANEKGYRGKHFDWSQLAARYFPTRVDEKCQQDPSLAVAHGCFWRYHPARAFEWELRLQDEIHPKFTIDEEGSDDYRQAFFDEHPDRVEDIRADEYNRRKRNADSEEDISPVVTTEKHPTSGVSSLHEEETHPKDDFEGLVATRSSKEGSMT